MLSVAGNSLEPHGDTLGYAFKWLASVRFRTSNANSSPAKRGKQARQPTPAAGQIAWSLFLGLSKMNMRDCQSSSCSSHGIRTDNADR
jgi:hypothetical protein